MSASPSEIERPLGLNAKPPRRPVRLDFGTIGMALAAIAVVAGSSAIALRDRNLRNPDKAAVSTPVETAAAAVAPATVKPATSGASGGASIIHVDPADAAKGSGVIIIRDPSALGQNLRVAHIPDRDLIENSPSGPLPVRAADGRRPFDVYARPWSGTRGARVAIIIGGLGVSQTGTQDAIAKLPPEVTLALASGGNSLSRWMQAARQKGHELVIQVPMEPFDYPTVDPGRATLTVDGAGNENLKNLNWTLSRTTNFVGVMNYMGARFVADAGAMGSLMDELARRGLAFVDDGSSARSTAGDLALKDRVPFAASDLTIDAERDRGAVLKKLDQLEATARARGFAVGTGSAFDVTVDAVTAWIGEAKRRGIEIVPVSAVAVDPEKG